MQKNKEIKFKSIIDGKFKWGEEQLLWCSVFMGTNDTTQQIKNFDKLLEYINIVQPPKQKINLISVIGGMFFFKLIEKVEFNHIVLFDSNINEHIKIVKVINSLINTKYELYDKFDSLDKQIRNNITEFYLPKAAGKQLSLEISKNSVFEFGNKKSSVETIFPPSIYPEFAWTPESRECFDKAKKNLTENLDRNIYCFLPETLINIPGSLTIVYLSNAFFDKQSPLTQEFVKSKVKSDYVIPLYCEANNDNTEVLDPHMWWEITVRELMKGKTLHIWSDDDAGLLGSSFDKIYDNSMTISDYIANGPRIKYDCLISHIIFGKNHNPGLFSDRLTKFKKMLERAKSTCKRIIIAEFDTEAISHVNHECLPSVNEIEMTAKAILNDYVDVCRRYSPGNLDPHRNVFIVFDRIK
jgi:hypothetical protein